MKTFAAFQMSRVGNSLRLATLALAFLPLAAPAGAEPMYGPMLPQCAAGDPVVGVNMQSHMYMSHEQMKMRMAGMSHAQMHAMMVRHHVRLMCRSSARAMGARRM